MALFDWFKADAENVCHHTGKVSGAFYMFPITHMAYQGMGYKNNYRLPFLFVIQNYQLPIEYHVNIWQLSLLLWCDITHLTTAFAKREKYPERRKGIHVLPQKLIGHKPWPREFWKSHYQSYHYSWITNDTQLIIHELMSKHECMIVFIKVKCHYIIVCFWDNITFSSRWI